MMITSMMKMIVMVTLIVVFVENMMKTMLRKIAILKKAFLLFFVSWSLC